MTVLMKEIGKLECPKKGGDMCLLQMGMDVKYSETENKLREEFRVERDRTISRMKTVYMCNHRSILSVVNTTMGGGTINRNQTIQ